jgi:peptide/nickel transport system permease protein
MTAIVRNEDHATPPAAKAGYVLPGLGHLLLGEFITGVGLLSLLALWIWATVVGLPRVPELFTAVGPWTTRIHPVIALITWVGLAPALWWIAHRRANPIQLSDDERNSNRQIFLRTFKRHDTGMMGLLGFLFLMLLTLMTPLIAAFHPDLIDVGPKNAAPDLQYFMGTDEYGRDLFSRVLYGGRISLSIGFIAVGISATIGTAIGAISAFAGGWVDRGLMFVVDMLMSMPRLVLLLAIVGIFRPKGAWSIYLIIIILGLTSWMGVSRLVRSQVLSLKQQEFIQAAQALGLSSTRVVFRHLIPNAMAPVIVYSSLAIGAVMLAEAGLSFLGLGVQPPTSTWGTLVNDGRGPLRVAPWIAIFPGFMIIAAVMSFNLIGDGLRDALDPKLRGH